MPKMTGARGSPGRRFSSAIELFARGRTPTRILVGQAFQPDEGAVRLESLTYEHRTPAPGRYVSVTEVAVAVGAAGVQVGGRRLDLHRVPALEGAGEGLRRLLHLLLGVFLPVRGVGAGLLGRHVV